MTEVIFIRHARSMQNKAVGPSHWTISQTGEEDIIRVVKESDIKRITRIYCSEELKAQTTAQGILKALQKEQTLTIIRDRRLNEVDRDQGPYFEQEVEFKEAVRRSFEEKNASYHNWEPATAAFKRFEQFMNEIEKQDLGQEELIGIVSHGTILNLYFAKIGHYYDQPDTLYKKWSQTRFCGWGKIVDGQIVRELL